MIPVIGRSRVLAWVLCVAGIALSAFVGFVEGEGTSDWLFPLAFIIGPWLVLAAFCLWWRRSRGLATAGLLLLASEIYIYYSVIIAPQSSTDALVYMVKPFLQVLLLLPVGLLVGWVGDKLVAYEAERLGPSGDGDRLGGLGYMWIKFWRNDS
jgi:hypothetical protein